MLSFQGLLNFIKKKVKIIHIMGTRAHIFDVFCEAADLSMTAQQVWM